MMDEAAELPGLIEPACDAAPAPAEPADFNSTADSAPEELEAFDSTDAPAFFNAGGPDHSPIPTHAAVRPLEMPGAVRRHPAVTAVAISLLVHLALGVGGYFAIRSLHLFVPARPQFSQGDGSVETGVTEHAGDDNVAAGAEGMGAPMVGWSGLRAGSGGLSDPTDDPAALHAPPTPPPPTAPPEVRDMQADANDVPPRVLDFPDPLDPANRPTFAPKPPPDSPAPPQDSQGPAREAAGGASGLTADAGFAEGNARNTGLSSEEPGGLIQRPGTGGAGGATTGAGGAAVTGRAGLRGPAPRPVYPEFSLAHREQGTVVLEIEVLESGAAGSVHVISDGGHPRLAAAALDAVRATRFSPALEDGRPVRSVLRCPFEFRLRQP